MSTPTLLLERTRLEKAAQDAGFDLTATLEGAWLVLRSSWFQQKLGVQLLEQSSPDYLLGMSDSHVAAQLANEFALVETGPASPWENCLHGIVEYDQLYVVLDRAAELYRAMAGTGLQHFHDRLQTPQNGTEVERMVRQRVGQDIFRASLLDYWGGRCALSGLDEPQLLRASHIKGWAQCDSDQERLDVFNGLLLAAHYDALFDSGWITFLDSGEIQISPHLKPQNRKILGLTGAEVLRGLTAFHAPYLQWHRTHWFRGA